MKRFFLVLILTIVVAGVLIYAMPKNFDSYISDVTSCGSVSIYCMQSDIDGIDMGNGKIVTCAAGELRTTLKQCSGVQGVSVSFDGNEQDVERIADLLHLDIVSNYELCGLVVTCGVSSRIRGGVTVDGNRVNVQIAYKDGVVTVGSPLILGSY